MEMTYKMIGGDGQEYGPTTLAELEAWVLDGRLLPATLVWSSETGRWTEAGRLPELTGSFERVLPADKATVNAVEMVPAGAWRRFGAFVADILLIYLLGSLLWPVVAAWWGVEVKPAPEGGKLDDVLEFARQNNPLLFFLQVCRLCFEVVFVGGFGATPGKMMAGIRVVTSDGGRVGYLAAAMRFFGRLFCELPFNLGYLTLLLRTDRRGLHDLLSGTAVVRVHPGQKTRPALGGE
ncbi:MAG: RDD family protein [Verrucomicrobiales bacterium]|nr:RDD family protein [Verrucomicrobiales bacterium]